MVSENKRFLEELKYIVENGFILNRYLIEQLQEMFDEKSASLITAVYQVLVENRHTLPFISDLEASVYDYMIRKEMTQAKTYYGAIAFTADLFGTTYTYIKCKVERYGESSYLEIGA